MYVNEELIKKARTSDLYNFLLSTHPELFNVEGKSLRMKGCGGLSIRQGYYGYTNFSNGETGNGIDFLMKYLRYSFQEAVLSLARAVKAPYFPASTEKPQREAVFPNPAPLPHSRMFGYLIQRGIPWSAVSDFARRGLIYQSEGNNNIVFINKERDYCEIRGTYTYAEKPFHGCIKVRPDRFWYFTGSQARPEMAYVTEAAIDAISLWLIHQKDRKDISASVYVSIGGAANHLAIDRLKRGIRTVLAVDNDNAGELCRNRHSDLDYILPTHKDWNEDLQQITKNH